jgi:hypothetical protein
MTLTNDQKFLIRSALFEKIDLWEKCQHEAKDLYPRLAKQFARQVSEAEAIIDKLEEEVEQ